MRPKVKYTSTAYRNDYICVTCKKMMLNKDAEYAIYMFGDHYCKNCSPAKTLRGADNPFKHKERPQEQIQAEVDFLKVNRIEDIPF